MTAHLTAEDLERWSAEGRAEERERVVGHVAACAECCASLAEVARTRPAEAGASRFDPADYAPTGGRALHRRAAWNALGRSVPLRLAAAGLVVLALGFLLRPRRDADSNYRGDATTLRLLRPVGDISAENLRFEWAPAGRGATFTLRVFDLAEGVSPLLEREVSEPGYSPAPEERARLRAGREYRWFVERRDAGGTTTVAPSARFSVR